MIQVCTRFHSVWQLSKGFSLDWADRGGWIGGFDPSGSYSFVLLQRFILPSASGDAVKG